MSLLAAFRFLTVFPLPVRRAFTPQEIGRSLGWYPLVGGALGGTLALLLGGLRRLYPASLAAALTLAAWAALTRGLHLDGWADTLDALWGGFTPQRRLEIMKDPRTGAFGAAGLTVLLLVKWAALLALPDARGLALAVVLGRWSLTLAVLGFPYARPQGLGATLKAQAGWREGALAALWTLTLAFGLSGWPGLAAWLTVSAGVWLFARWALRLLPGLTGDLYGAICEGAETLTLLLLAGW